MRANITHTAGPDDPVARIPSCALDQAGQREQYARYRQLAGWLTRLDRADERITLEFDESVDRDLLKRTLAVERECCPFFVFRFTSTERRLEISVQERQQLPALEALAAAFAKAQDAMTPCEQHSEEQ